MEPCWHSVAQVQPAVPKFPHNRFSQSLDVAQDSPDAFREGRSAGPEQAAAVPSVIMNSAVVVRIMSALPTIAKTPRNVT